MKFTQTIAIAALAGAASAADAAAFSCPVGKIEQFTDKECKTPDEAANKKADEALKKFNDENKEHWKNMKVECTKKEEKKYVKPVCDATGFGPKFFSDKDCTKDLEKPSDDEKKAFTAWGACETLGEKSFKVSDASVLKAGAFAALALIASQF